MVWRRSLCANQPEWGATSDMVITATLLFPLLLLLFMLVMERVERPLRVDAIGEQVESSLTQTTPADELEELVSEGFAPALEGYWRRRRLARMLPRRSASRV